MNISTVNELIASLETAGEPSIREQKFLKLAKAYQQLAAENVALKNAITDHSHSVHFCEVCGKDDPCSTDDVCYALKDIPATDRIVAGIKADGVESGIKTIMTMLNHQAPGVSDAINVLRVHSSELSEGAK
ncbi:hypothetical protein RE164_003617 [Klebsiella pneumoniae]|uniref:hypothetical protein n=1 Tax=Klebsiella pneumoniae TaxID=573 RepID=UPI001CBB7747|nr:hypothetical protein [Klebsiella pneumoniae]EKV5710830.1 hypothetical protein [Klebsiella pneumoniae]EKZ6850720.1 hypothetical protein [Klebsiella pneumoniae]MCB7583397.1 hypothetical protein [Klebsiella pneumoniae]